VGWGDNHFSPAISSVSSGGMKQQRNPADRDAWQGDWKDQG
jgi:hypothetical protein